MIDEKILEKIKPGALLTVVEAITEGDKTRSGYFKGLVIAKKHGKESGATFTVRSVVGGVIVEKIYMINSPLISSVKIHSTPKKVHKSKLYFVRGMSKREMQKKLGVSI